MKKKVTAVCIVVVLLFFGVSFLTKGRVVNPHSLDYISAKRVDSETIVVGGAWDAPGGSYLNAATHRIEGNKVIVRLYAKSTLTKSRIFTVVIPSIKQALSSIYIENGDGELTELNVVAGERRSGILGLTVESRKID